MNYDNQIIKIWADILKKEPGLEERFEIIGGTSIQMISMLLVVNDRFEINISPEEFMANPTVSDLVHCIQLKQSEALPTSLSDEEALESKQAYPLLPIHHSILERANCHHYNCAALYNIKDTDKKHLLKQAISAVIAQNDGLRMRMVNKQDDWHLQFQKQHEMHQWWHEEDLANVADSELASTITAICDQYQEKSHVENKTMSIVYFDLGPHREARLLILLHHILIDWLSEQILLRNIERAYKQLENDQQVSLMKSGTSMREWTTLLKQYSDKVAPEFVDYWQGLAWHLYRPIPVEQNIGGLEDASSAIARPRFSSFTLSEVDSQKLLEIQQKESIDASYLVIAALSLAYKAWSDSDVFVLTTVNNGRMIQKIKNVNLMSTIGWLSNFSTQFIDNTANLTGKAFVHAIIEQLNCLDDDKLSLTCLESNTDLDIKRKMKALPSYHFSFNFVPSNNDFKSYEFMFKKAEESSGTNEKGFSAQMIPYIDAMFIEKKLDLKMYFSPSRYTQETIAAFLENTRMALRDLISSFEK